MTRLAAAMGFALVLAACSDASVTPTAEPPPTTSPPATDAPTTTTTTTVPPTTAAPPTTEAVPQPAITFELANMPPAPSGAHYEGWLIIGDQPVSTGRFTVSADGNFADLDGNGTNPFIIDVDPTLATAVVITIEPDGDADPAPSATKLLAGDVTDGVAELSIDHPAALGTDFADASGIYVLATPTDGDRTNNEESGVWFLVFPGPTAGLDLPELPEGWSYEGWTVINGIPVTTGTFRSVTGSDEAAPYSGTVRTPAFPGEDYLVNAPEGLEFPVDLRGSTVVVTVEPRPDTDPGPYPLRVLAGPIPPDAELEPVSYPITTEGFTPPTGTATLEAVEAYPHT